MVFINDKIKALFLHIPKCGGCYIRDILTMEYDFKELTSLKHEEYDSFFENKNDIKLNEDTDKHTIRKMGKYRYMITHQEVDKEIFDTYFTFTFVRNPYTRIYSAYLYLKRLLTETKEGNKTRNSFENKEYFTDFNTFIKNYKNVNNISYFHAFITQYDQLCDFSNNIKINYIGKQENLDIDFLKILHILGVNEIKHSKELYYNIRNNSSEIDDTNSIKELYNEESFDFVNRYFEKDFKIFHYDKYETFAEFKEFFKLNNDNKNSTIQMYKNIISIDYGNDELAKQLEKYKKILDYLLEENINSSKNFKYRRELIDIRDLIEKLKNDTEMIYNLNRNYIKAMTKDVTKIMCHDIDAVERL